jgi:quercetin dioxygenase-like cupin family protein
MFPALPMAVGMGAFVTSAIAQTPAGPTATQILKGDLAGQANLVQESTVTMVEFPPATAAPRHMHPGAQEILYVAEGSLIVEVQGQPAKTLKAGEAGLIPADVPHLARNESTRMAAKAIAFHSRSDKAKPFVVAVTA